MRRAMDDAAFPAGETRHEFDRGVVVAHAPRDVPEAAMAERRTEMEGQAKAYFTIPQLADYCGVPKSALYAAARRGDLKTAMPKGCERLKLVKMEWFEEWIGVGE